MTKIMNASPQIRVVSPAYRITHDIDWISLETIDVHHRPFYTMSSEIYYSSKCNSLDSQFFRKHCRWIVDINISNRLSKLIIGKLPIYFIGQNSIFTYFNRLIPKKIRPIISLSISVYYPWHNYEINPGYRNTNWE